jgi:cellulose synthase/poly-beta-1,6-N-acetylglucosamine synthase-like glycosyltransferase
LGFAIALLRLVYVLCILILALYTCGQLYLLYTYLIHSYFRRRYDEKLPDVLHSDVQLPKVTVQLPLFNERYVARRIIDAVAALDYPRECLHIQVLDDSTDDTTDLIQGRIAQLQSEGLRIDLMHRARRTGYKAGALANGLLHTDGEFIAIFDADFIPAPDFLRRTVPYFLADPQIGVIQTRWGHLNDDENLLTRSQALAIDGHFAVEQYARCAGDLLFNFNGTCGLWRRTCIEDAGGWQSETLTEDFDLSYRAQIRGWRFWYLRDVVVPGEVPPQIHAFKQQQARWAKGSTQVLLKMIGPLLRSRLSLRKRVMGALQLFQYAVQPVMLLTLSLTPIMMLTRSLNDVAVAPLGVLGLGVPFLYVLGQQALYDDWLVRSMYFPILMVFSSGMTVNNSRAALSALLGKPGEFKRTPKFHLGGRSRGWKRSRYAKHGGSDLLWEIGFGLYTLIAALMAESLAPSFVVYFLLYATAFFSIAGWGISERISLQRPVPNLHGAEAEPIGQPGR